MNMFWQEISLSKGRTKITDTLRCRKASYMNGKLYFSGTETAAEFAGYMEGAVISAVEMATKL
ncbi:MAG: hypothetical protein QM727_02855 [Niabella sp.]